MESRRLSPAAIGAIVGALLLGLLLGITSGAVDRLFGGADPKVIASSSLESMRAQNRLVAFVARYVSVTSAKTSRLGFSAERTLILPGDVRYEVDLSRLREEDVSWDADSHTLTVRLPEVELAGPEVDLAAAREYGQGGLLGAVTNVEGQLDDANRAAAVADLRKQASAQVPMRLAREAARSAIERSFSLPLKAAGFADAKVVARFATEGADDPSYIDRSLSYNQAMEQARKRREGAQ
jgi:hypothetical protein